MMSPYQYWLEIGVKIFSLQITFLRPSILDLKTDESDPSFLSVALKLLIISIHENALIQKTAKTTFLLITSTFLL